MCVCVCRLTYIDICGCINVHACMHDSLPACICRCQRVGWIYTKMYTYLYIYVCIYICVYMYI